MEDKMVFNTNSAFPSVPLIVRRSHCAFSCSLSHSFCLSSDISCSFSCQYCASAERWDWTIEMAAGKCYTGKARKMSFTVKGIRKKEHMDVEMMRAELLSHGGMIVWFLAAEFCCIVDCIWVPAASHALSGVRDPKHVSLFVSSQLISSDADGAIQRAGRFRVENGSSDEVQAANTGWAHSLVSWKWHLSAAKANTLCLFQWNTSSSDIITLYSLKKTT